jgi:hypothetical protein
MPNDHFFGLIQIKTAVSLANFSTDWRRNNWAPTIQMHVVCVKAPGSKSKIKTTLDIHQEDFPSVSAPLSPAQQSFTRNPFLLIGTIGWEHWLQHTTTP